MKISRRIWFVCLIIGLCFFMSTAYKYQSNVQTLIHNGDLVYLANTVVVKYKYIGQSSPAKVIGIENILVNLLIIQSPCDGNALVETYFVICQATGTTCL